MITVTGDFAQGPASFDVGHDSSAVSNSALIRLRVEVRASLSWSAVVVLVHRPAPSFAALCRRNLCDH